MGDAQRSLSPSPTSPLALNLEPLSIHSELWYVAEQRIEEILYAIQPALPSEQKRKEVIDYIQRLLRTNYATEVFAFGSVPLKTYLPDGDIDLTTLSHKNMEEELAQKVCDILKSHEQDFEFQVKDIQYIEAQVKVVKCSVKDIAVDISFNQVAGLCALCFLEQVDQIIGRGHLFKHSIILIKAWCFYESRILGAHHGLISTYALEVLVLYIINRFHSSLPGPLAVLHKFLDFYSTFDWEKFCVSINGPIPLTPLQGIAAKSLENNGNELLLSQEFLRNCRELFSIPIKALEGGGHEFPVKHLNIVDPLKDGNNLGRSVNKGNFYRIRCALSYGAQRLAEVLRLPGEKMGRGIEKFFTNTLDRNGKGQRADAQVPVHAFGTGRVEVTNLSGDYDDDYSGLLRGQWYHNYKLPSPPRPSPPPSPSYNGQKNSGDSPSCFMQCKKYAFPQRIPDAFVPRLPFYRPYTSPSYTAAISFDSFDRAGKSRGTGTYIPDMATNPYRDLLSWVRARSLDSRPRGPFSRSPRKTEQVEDHSQTENCADGSRLYLSQDQFSPRTEKSGLSQDQFSPKTEKSGLSQDEFSPRTEKSGNGNSVDLSMDQFPLLPFNKKSVSSENRGHSGFPDLSLGKLSPEESENESFLDHSLDQFPPLPSIKKSMSSEICQSCQPFSKSMHAECCSAALERIEFGTYKPSQSPLGLPSLTETKPPDAGVSTSLETMPANQDSEFRKQGELVDSDEEMVCRQQYQLKNDRDFPPLCL